MKRIIHVLLIPLLTFILVGCLGEKLTEFKDCFPPVSLISTESTPTIEIINSRSDWDILKVASNNDYFVCIRPNSNCGSFADLGYDFTTLPLGTEIKLDGYAVLRNKVTVDPALYFRGETNFKTVWLRYQDVRQLADPANESSFTSIGMQDGFGNRVDQINWECPNKN